MLHFFIYDVYNIWLSYIKNDGERTISDWHKSVGKPCFKSATNLVDKSMNVAFVAFGVCFVVVRIFHVFQDVFPNLQFSLFDRCFWLMENIVDLIVVRSLTCQHLSFCRSLFLRVFWSRLFFVSLRLLQLSETSHSSRYRVKCCCWCFLFQE